MYSKIVLAFLLACGLQGCAFLSSLPLGDQVACGRPAWPMKLTPIRVSIDPEETWVLLAYEGYTWIQDEDPRLLLWLGSAFSDKPEGTHHVIHIQIDDMGRLGPNEFSTSYVSYGAESCEIRSVDIIVNPTTPVHRRAQVIAHELGHALGLLHSQAQSGDLMEPFWEPVSGLGDGDRAELRARYPR